ANCRPPNERKATSWSRTKRWIATPEPPRRRHPNQSSSPRPWLKRCPSTGCAGSTDRGRPCTGAGRVRSRSRMAVAPTGGRAARALWCAVVSLRNSQTVVPEEPHHPRGGAIVGRISGRPRRLPGRGRAGLSATALLACARRAGRVAHAGAGRGEGGSMTTTVPRLIEQFEHGVDAPICLTWELTYACNLACVHCLSSSGKRDPRELSTQDCKNIIDELERMQVFYVNIGGGEPTVRPDFWELVDYATAHHVGVKFSTNGVRITPEVAARLAASDYVDVQISLDGATAEVNDAVRDPGSFAMAIRALENLAAAGFSDAKISVVVTRHNVDQLDEF